MESRSSGSSDEERDDDTDRRLSSLVLRPALTNLPSIGDDDDSDDDDDSAGETEVVFSSINWAAQESMIGDEDLISPRPLRPAAPRPTPPVGSAARLSGVEGPRPTSTGPSAIVAAAMESPTRGGHSGPSLGPSSSPRGGAPSQGHSVAVAARPALRQQQQQQLRRPVKKDSDDEDDLGGSEAGGDNDDGGTYEGRGWLAGAAGRLANVEERKRAAANATDEEQVAAAARDARALQLHLQQLSVSAAASAAASSPTASASLSPSGAGDASCPVRAAMLQKIRQKEQEDELRINRDFHETVKAAESEPPLVASSGLSLEATVAGLGMDDLDALIARLSTGAAQVAAVAAGPSPSAAAATAPAAAGAVVGRGGGGGGGNLWSLELPAPESLWSDEEEDAGVAGQRLAARSPPAAGSVARSAPPTASARPEPAAVPAAVAKSVAAPVATAAAATAPAGGAAAHPPSPLSPPPAGLPPPLPAKFKFFASPTSSDPTGLTAPLPPGAPPPPPAAAATGPVKLDLRQSIADAGKRNEREAVAAAERAAQEAAAAAAQRVSQAKAAAARRRVMESDSDDDDGDGGAGGAATRVRPQPPARPQALPAPPAPQPAPAPAPASSAGQSTATASDGPPTAPNTVTTAAPKRAPFTDSSTSATSLTAAPATSSTSSTAAGNATAVTKRAPPTSSSTTAATSSSTSATSTAASMGTDSSDLRAATSRSVFVGTHEHEPEDKERLSDIREYLKVRGAAKGAATGTASTATPAAAPSTSKKPQAVAGDGDGEEEEGPPQLSAEEAAAAAAKSASERRWPEMPVAVTQREAALAAPAAKAARKVATFSGGGDGDDAGHARANGVAAASATATATTVTAAVAAADEAAPRGFAQCSTEGDEDLLAEPTAASVVDASRERGSRMAAAGTVLPLSARTAAGAAATSTSSSTGLTTAADVRPSSLQLPTTTTATKSRTPTSTSAAAAAASPAPTSPSPLPSPAHTDLGRLPAWLPPTSCFTLLLASPANLPSGEVGALLEWLLRVSFLASGDAKEGPAKEERAAKAPPGMPAFSIVGARLLGVAPASPLLSSAAAAFFTAPSSAAATAAASAAASSGAGDVRVLAVACVARGGVDADMYCHAELPTAAAATAPRAMLAALGSVPWDAVLPQPQMPSSTGDGAPPSAAAAAKQALGAWATTQAGAAHLFSPLRLPSHALHQQYHGATSTVTPRSSWSGIGGLASGGSTPTAAAAATAAEAAGSVTFVTVVSAGVLRQPELLRGLLGRAACLGLTLRGLQMGYATEEAVAALVAATPHRPAAFTGAALLALSGHNEPLRRWQGALGPPDPRLAATTDPTSLHALYGEAARHITASYDTTTAAREVAALFGSGGGGSAVAGGGHAHVHALGTALTPSPRGVGAGEQEEAEVGLACGGTVQSQWLALPAAGASQQAAALWCAQHLVWCGYSLRGLLMCALPAALQVNASGKAATTTASVAAQGSVVVLEVSKEEAAEQLPLLLASMPVAPSVAALALTQSKGAGTAAAVAVGGPGGPGAAAVHSLLSLETLRSQLLPSDMHTLPQPYIAEQLLASIAASAPASDFVGRPSWDGGAAAGPTSPSSSAAAAAAMLHPHAEDGVAVVALQSRPMHAAALVLAALVAHTTASVASTSACVGQQMELVACRYVRQVPSDIAHCLAVQQPLGSAVSAATGLGGGGSGATAAGGGRQRLVISHPALVAVFHGPAAAARVSVLLQTAVSRLAAAQQEVTATSPMAVAAAQPAAAAAAAGGSDAAAWQALLDKLLREYPTVLLANTAGHTAPHAPLLAAVSSSQAAAKSALAHAFGPGHVFLDAAMHDGLHRPPLPHPSSLSPLSTSAAAAAVTLTPLGRLLAGPERLPAVVALDYGALHRNLLPRLLKQMVREGYTLHAAATTVVEPDGAVAAAMPGLAARAPAVLLHVSRSNAVMHVRRLVAALLSTSGGSSAATAAAGAGGVFTCGTWREAVAVVSEVWQSASAYAAADSGASATTVAAPAKRFVRPEGSRLLQLTTMVVTPSKSTPDPAAAPTLDLPRLADALEALHTEGFRLAALLATAATGRDVASLASRAACRISPAQQQAVHSSAAAAAQVASGAASAASTGAAAAAPPLPLACNLVVVALARDNAVTSLQILLDEAAAATVAGAGPAAQRGGRREAAAVLAALGPCVSVSHSPAAAEHQVVTVFEGGAFGAAGVPLLQ